MNKFEPSTSLTSESLHGFFFFPFFSGLPFPFPFFPFMMASGVLPNFLLKVFQFKAMRSKQSNLRLVLRFLSSVIMSNSS